MTMRKEYEQSGLPDLPNPSLRDVKEQEKALEGEIVEREKKTGRKLEVLADPKRPDIKLPVKVAYQQDKIDLGKLPIWYLQALGSMTIKEYNQFMKDYENELTVNELIASDMLTKVLNKDNVATERFWRMQEKIMMRPQVVAQVNICQLKPDSVMSSLLDQIESNLDYTPTKLESQ